jgi:hypothetical protein
VKPKEPTVDDLLPLAEKLDRGSERHRLTLEALSDVDAGRLIDHQTVQAWADSLDIPSTESGLRNRDAGV